MEVSALQQLKAQILEACNQKVEARIAEALAAMNRAADAALSEEKSSAGDKYETGRAMGYLDRERYAQVLQQANKELQFYRQLKLAPHPEQAAPGVLVCTENQFILLATGIGKLNVDGHAVLVVSMLSPLGQTVRGLKPGDTFSAGGVKHKISFLV